MTDYLHLGDAAGMRRLAHEMSSKAALLGAFLDSTSKQTGALVFLGPRATALKDDMQSRAATVRGVADELSDAAGRLLTAAAEVELQIAALRRQEEARRQEELRRQHEMQSRTE